MEGKDFYTFKKTQIDITKAEENYAWWEKKLKIPKTFDSKYSEVLKCIENTFGSHTFPYHYKVEEQMEYPILKIFSFNGNNFSPDKNSGLKCLKLRGGGGSHMTTAKDLGLDNLIFSYIGMHLPYHREDDVPPVSPFGLFIDVGDFAFTHGSPCDRDYNKNNLVEKENLDRYFLTPKDLNKLLTHRIMTDPLFKKKYMDYYGNIAVWEDDTYVEESWKKKGELCFYEKVSTTSIKAILWPLWEQYCNLDENMHEPDELQKYTAEFNATFKDTKIIYYRPYRDIINEQNWGKINMRDWELALVEASSLAQEYYLKYEVFPESIDDVKIAFDL